MGPIGQPTVADNCTVASITSDAPAAFDLDSTLVTWTVTDQSGNTATCQQLVIVFDTIAPVIDCPSDLTVSPNIGCDYSGSIGTPNYFDNCHIASVSNNAPFIFPAGVTDVLWTIADSSGNTTTCVQQITVIDNIAPSIQCPSDITVSANANCEYVGSIGDPVTSDPCGVASVTNDAPASFPLGMTMVTWTVSDLAGNESSCIQWVTVVDNTAPIIDCPSDQVLSLDANCQVALPDYTSLVTVDENCSLMDLVQSPAPGTVVNGEVQVLITMSAIDASGNTASCSFNVNVIDDTDPIVQCPSDITLELDANCELILEDLTGQVNVTENCSAYTIEQLSLIHI